MRIEAAGDPNAYSFDPAAAQCAWSVVTVARGWPGDVARLAASLQRHCSGFEMVVVSNDAPDVAGWLEEWSPGFSARAVVFSQHVGFAAASNTGVAVSSGRAVVVADPSVEAGGDFLPPLAEALAGPGVGLAGPWGLVSEDLRDFREAGGGEVDAMQGYCLAFVRERAAGPGLFDPRYKFYRHADVDLSLRWRDAGFRVVALDLPLTRHAHREWESLDPDRRDKKSRENHARLMRAWGGREDLLLANRG